MNFLAHCALAEDAVRALRFSQPQQIGLLAGAVIGDFVKGPIDTQWPLPLQGGVRLHRKIDVWSNQNKDVKRCSQRFPAELRRFAPIFVDLLADYHLSRCWSDYYAEELRFFSQRCYQCLAEYTPFMSANALRFFTYMQDVDLLANYADWANVERGLQSVLRRLNRQELAQQVHSVCAAVATESEHDFRLLYPALQQQCTTWNVFADDGQLTNAIP